MWNELFFTLNIDQTNSVNILCQFVQTTCVCLTGYWTVPNYYYSIKMCRFCVHFLQQKECNTQLLNRLLPLETLLSLTENQVQGFCTYVWGMRHKRPTLRSQLLHRIPTLWYNWINIMVASLHCPRRRLSKRLVIVLQPLVTLPAQGQGWNTGTDQLWCEELGFRQH